MKPQYTLIAALFSASLPVQAGNAILSIGHVDVGVAYEEGEWDLHLHDDNSDVEYEPADVVLRVNGDAAELIPDDPAYAFLGEPGGQVWILPAVNDPGLLFLGLGGEEISSGVFQNDSVRLTLKRFQGPGEFALFEHDVFGTPAVNINTRDGVNEADFVEVPVGSHAHSNWAFSKPGKYRLTVDAAGSLTDGTVVSSGLVTYTFRVGRESAAKH